MAAQDSKEPQDSIRSRTAPPESWAPARNTALALLRPLERFIHIQASSGIVLMIVAVVALVWANSPWKDVYHHLWHMPITVSVGSLSIEHSLHFWINDGLMVIFFFVVGLEIRREIHSGELSEVRRAALPVAAALGGMAAPALIYVGFNYDSPTTIHGWGVPTATDIAFAVGVLAILGKRVPPALRVLLLALAIIDDIGAIVVIAVFYSSGVQIAGLVLAVLGILLTLGMQWLGFRRPLLYVIPGLVIWAGMLVSGVHPTIAGVVIGLLTPARPWFGIDGFLEEANEAIQDFRGRLAGDDVHSLIYPLARLNTARQEALAPVIRLESALNPYVAFGIMPLFALANAGVTVGDVDLSQKRELFEALGIGLGLAVGKPLGIVTASYVAVRLGLAALPRGVDWRGVFVVGMVGGIGFTMALFIDGLAFTEPMLLNVGKLAVLVGSLIAGVVGLVVGLLLLSDRPSPEAAKTVAEAELSTDA